MSIAPLREERGSLLACPGRGGCTLAGGAPIVFGHWELPSGRWLLPEDYALGIAGLPLEAAMLTSQA